MNFIVRKGGADDVSQACEVVRRSIQECCTDDHQNDSEILVSWLRNKTPENFQTWFESDGFAVVAEKGGQIVGTAMLKADGTIVLFYVLPEVRFIGVGKAMLCALEAEALQRGLGRLKLGSTKTAHTFYVRAGFADMGKDSTAFGLSARLMQKDIGKNKVDM